jgi:hypothetical protein
MSLYFGVFALGMVVWSVADGNAPEVNSYMFVYPPIMRHSYPS